jgi:PASTA domain
MTAHLYTLEQYYALQARVRTLENFLSSNFATMQNGMNKLKSEQSIKAMQDFYKKIPDLLGTNISNYPSGKYRIPDTEYHFTISNTSPARISASDADGTIKNQVPAPGQKASVGSDINVTVTKKKK